MHDGVDVERHAAPCAVVGMCGADVDEVEIHIDDAHTKVRRGFHSRHLPIGHHNHAVALPEVKLAAAVTNLALARRAVGMGDIAFHTRLRDAIETVVDDDISLVEFHGAKLQKICKPSLRLSCGIFRRIQESIMPLGKEFAFSV